MAQDVLDAVVEHRRERRDSERAVDGLVGWQPVLATEGIGSLAANEAAMLVAIGRLEPVRLGGEVLRHHILIVGDELFAPTCEDARDPRAGAEPAAEARGDDVKEGRRVVLCPGQRERQERIQVELAEAIERPVELEPCSGVPEPVVPVRAVLDDDA